MFANRLSTLGGSPKSLVQKAIAILQKYGANAHVYLPGVGVVNGVTAGNYLDYTETIGGEQMANPSFAAATGWTQGSGWMITTNMATATTASGALTQTALVLGQYDQVQVTTTAASAGSFDVLLGGVKLITISTVGTFTVRGTAGGTTLSLSGNGYTGVVTLASVKSVTGASITLGAVDSSVGQLVDAGHVGSELVANLNLSSPFVLGGVLGGAGTKIPVTSPVGNIYKIVYVITQSDFAGTFFHEPAGGCLPYAAYSKSVGTWEYVVRAQDNDAAFNFQLGGGGSPTGSITFSSFSIKQLTGINAFQATSENRPVLRRGLVALNKYTQDFSQWFSTAAGTLTTGQTDPFGGTNATLFQGANKNLYETSALAGSLAASTTVTQAIYCYSATAGTIKIGSANGGSSAFINVGVGWGLYSFSFATSGANDGPLIFLNGTLSQITLYRSAIFAGNVTPTEIPLTTTAPASSSQGNYALEFNGTSNYLQMAQPLFQMSDDHCVIAGGRFAGGSTVLNVLASPSNSLTGNRRLGQVAYNASNSSVQSSWYDGTNYDNLEFAFSANTNFVATALKIGSTLSQRVNGAQVNTKTATVSFTANSGSIGGYSDGTSPFSGSIYPIIAIKGIQAADVPILEKFVGMLTGPSGVYF